MATGGWAQELTKLMAATSDVRHLSSCGFQSPSALLSESEVCLDNVIAAHTHNFLMQLMAHRFWSMSELSCSPPSRFAALLGDVGCRGACLLEVSEWFAAMSKLELVAEKDGSAKSFYDSLLFPVMQWVRYVFICLAEYNFTDVSDSLSADLEKWASGFITQKIVEDINRCLRERSFSNSHEAISRPSRWYVAASSDVLEDYGREPVRPTMRGRLDSKGVVFNASHFVPNEDRMTLPVGLVDSITDNTSVYPHMSPQTLHGKGFRWSCWVQCQDWDTFVSFWPSLLLQVGTVVHCRLPGGTRSGLILHSTRWGASLMQVKLLSSTGVWKWSVGSSFSWSVLQISVTDLATCTACEVEGCSPRRLHQEIGGDVEVVPALGFCKVGEVMSVTRLAAYRAFAGLTVPFLKQLFALLEAPGPMPSLELELVRALAAHILGADATEDVVERILHLRRKPSKANLTTPLDSEENIDIGKGVMGAEDGQDFEKSVRKSLDKPKKAKHAADASSGAHGGARGEVPSEAASARDPEASCMGDGAASSSMALAPAALVPLAPLAVPRERAPPLRAPTVGHEEDLLKWAKELLPEAAKLHGETRWHRRMKCMYPCVSPPYSHSCSITEHTTPMTAAIRCIAWAWQEHFKKTGGKCPFRIDALPAIVGADDA